MMKLKFLPLFAILVTSLLFVPTASTQNSSCALTFDGSDRKAVKLRRPRQPNYTFVNGGRAITVASWFGFVCGLDPDTPTKRTDVPQTVAMDTERYQAKIRSFLLAVRREPDNDYHVQIGETADWDQEQVVVEIPPGQVFCEGRTTLEALMRADGWNGRSKDHIFRTPPKVDVTGFVFLDSAHMPANSRRSDWCRQNGGRGIKNGLTRTPVRGLWELHPVLRIESVQ